MKATISTKKALAIVLTAIVLTAIVTYVFAASSTIPLTISGGNYPGAPSYTIWREGSNYFAKNASGVVEFSGTNASQVINNALASGDKVMLLAGNYTITNPIIINSGNTLTGETFTNGYADVEYSTVLVLADNAQCNVILRSKTGSPHQNIAIKNLLIDGNKANNPDNGVDGDECGIYLGAVQGFLIENVKIVNTRREGIYLASCSYGRVESVIVGGSERGGIILDATAYTDIINCVAYENTGTGGAKGCGIEISTNTNLKFAVNIIGGRFFDNEFGIGIRNYGAGTYTQMVAIQGAATFENLYDGIWLIQAAEVSIQGVFSYFNNRSGLLIDDSYNITVSSSFFYDNDYANSESTYGNGINVQNGNFTVIIGCFSGNKYGTSQNYGYREFGTADYNTLIGCILRGNNVLPYQIVGSNTHINFTWNGTSWIS